MMIIFKICFLALMVIIRCNAFVTPQLLHINKLHGEYRQEKWKQSHDDTETAFDDLMTMDVVIFLEKNLSSQRKLGAVQDDGRIAPLSVWTLEPAFGNSLEFLVDEEDLFPGFLHDQTEVHAIVPQNLLSYGSRQVGGGMGPGNPHGEESELLYYVDRSFLAEIEVTVRPELEIFW